MTSKIALSKIILEDILCERILIRVDIGIIERFLTVWNS
jgi:hypothetical protein